MSWDERHSIEDSFTPRNNIQLIRAKPVYYLMLRGWFFAMDYFYDNPECNDTILRMPNVIFGVLGALACFFLGRKFCDIGIGLILALLASVSWLNIWHCQDARFYPLMFLMSCLTGIYTWKILLGDSRIRNEIIWIACMLIAILNHPMSLLSLGSIGVGIGICLIDDVIVNLINKKSLKLFAKKYISLFLSAIVVVLLFIPFVLKYLISTFNVSAKGIASRAGHGGEAKKVISFTRDNMERIFGDLGAGTDVPFYIYLSIACVGVLTLLIWKRKVLFFCLAQIFVPLFILSKMRHGHFFDVRYILFLQPYYLLIIAVGCVGITWTVGNIFRSLCSGIMLFKYNWKFAWNKSLIFSRFVCYIFGSVFVLALILINLPAVAKGYYSIDNRPKHKGMAEMIMAEETTNTLVFFELHQGKNYIGRYYKPKYAEVITKNKNILQLID